MNEHYTDDFTISFDNPALSDLHNVVYDLKLPIYRCNNFGIDHIPIIKIKFILDDTGKIEHIIHDMNASKKIGMMNIIFNPNNKPAGLYTLTDCRVVSLKFNRLSKRKSRVVRTCTVRISAETITYISTL